MLSSSLFFVNAIIVFLLILFAQIRLLKECRDWVVPKPLADQVIEYHHTQSSPSSWCDTANLTSIDRLPSKNSIWAIRFLILTGLAQRLARDFTR